MDKKGIIGHVQIDLPKLSNKVKLEVYDLDNGKKVISRKATPDLYNMLTKIRQTKWIRWQNYHITSLH